MRGREVSRVEGFSDAVFGFALTLLVVSLEVPENFEGLEQTLSGFLPFAATFSVVCWIWYEHYAFFRKFGLQDGLTITLNCVLLFVVLFFVYPLKFVFGNLIPALTGLGRASHLGFTGMTPADARLLLATFSGGFVAVFTVLALLHWNAWRQRAALQLTPLEIFDARGGVRAHGLSVAIGIVSILLALTLPARMLGLAGFLYFLQGPVQGLNGHLNGKARARIVPSSTRAHP
jgi:hypothetical protein